MSNKEGDRRRATTSLELAAWLPGCPATSAAAVKLLKARSAPQRRYCVECGFSYCPPGYPKRRKAQKKSGNAESVGEEQKQDKLSW